MQRRDFIRGAAVGAGAAATTSLATPAVAQGAKDMVIVSTWPRDFPGLGVPAQRLAARIEALTDGSIRVQYYASGERVGAFDSFDHVASGEAQGYTGADYYWKGIDQAFVPFTSIPFGLTAPEQAAWIYGKGGQELWEEVADQFGLITFAMGNTGVQMGGWFNKEINSPDDLKGLTMRIPGDGGDVYARLGASPVALPGSQIYENLVSGSIDATEWVGPWNDYFLKFYEAAKYYYWPGFHEPGGHVCLGMNKSWWSTLTANEQEIIRSACAEENIRTMAETNANNGEYLRRLVEEHGVELREFNDDVYQAFGEASQEVFETSRDASELAGRVYDAVAATRQEVGNWMKRSNVSYSLKRNRVLGI